MGFLSYCMNLSLYIMSSYLRRILLRNFHVGLNMSHRQLLDCVAKGNFIEIDPHIAHEVIEGIVGTLPQQKGPHHTQEETQVFEKICEVTKIL